MSNTSLDLSNKLPAEQVDIIRHVVRAAESRQLRLFIVGAQARDLLLQLSMTYRFIVLQTTSISELSSKAGMSSPSFETI